MTDLADTVGLPSMAETAADYLERLVPEVIARHAGGKVTITLAVKPEGDGVEVVGTVVLKLPPHPADTNSGWHASLWWADGEVLTENPQQAPLPLPGTITIHTRRDAS